jgi:ABC-2 type transport system permease protein
MSGRDASAAAHGHGALRRILALIRKETWQVMRDSSSIAVGVVMPLMLLLLFGYGLNLDLKNVPVALVVEDGSENAQGAASGFELSDYFRSRRVKTMAEAERLLLDRKVNAIVRIPWDFTRRLEEGNAEIQVITHGVDANTARMTQAYAQGALGAWQAREAARGRMLAPGGVTIENRMWFNEANVSTHFLVPGLIVLIMTLIGALLTALVVAREWERGTFEALFVTPVRPIEVLLGKTVPYFILGMIGLALSTVGALVLFGVPLRGSLLVLSLVSALYLLVALCIGLVISSATRSQFLASQICMMVTFLPALMLSGFMFDIRSIPWAIQIVTYLVPARYFVAVLQTLFLAGNVWSVILPNAAVLAVMAILLMGLSVRLTRKRIG